LATSTEGFWRALEQLLGGRLPERARTYIRLQGFDETWVTAEPAGRKRLLADAERQAVNVMAAYEGLRTQRVENPRTTKAPDDQRWRLWRDLMRARAAAEGQPVDPPWEPMRFYLVRDHSADPLPNKRVEISFDWRLPRAALENEVRKAWRHMVRNRWVRPGKPLSRHLADLIRFNCLVVAPDTAWRDRNEMWNAQCAQDEVYDDVRKFERAFRRAEVQLTGKKWGLAWFYDGLVRSGRLARLNTPEEAELRGGASKRLIEMYRELYDPSFMQPPEWFEQVYREAEEEEARPDYRSLHWAKRRERGMRYEQDWGENG